MATRKSTWIIFGIFVISACFLESAIQAGAQTSVINDAAAAWSSYDMEKVASLYTDDIVYEDIAFGSIKRGKEELRAFIKECFVMFSDWKTEVKSSVISGDWGYSEWIWSATHTGNHPKLPATGKRFSIRGASVYELKEGKIKRKTDYYNLVDFLQQIGIKLIPAPPPK